MAFIYPGRYFDVILYTIFILFIICSSDFLISTLTNSFFSSYQLSLEVFSSSRVLKLGCIFVNLGFSLFSSSVGSLTPTYSDSMGEVRKCSCIYSDPFNVYHIQIYYPIAPTYTADIHNLVFFLDISCKLGVSVLQDLLPTFFPDTNFTSLRPSLPQLLVSLDAASSSVKYSRLHQETLDLSFYFFSVYCEVYFIFVIPSFTKQHCYSFICCNQSL